MAASFDASALDQPAAEAVHAHAFLHAWLLGPACTLWWERGADPVHGGFHERLRLDGTPSGEPRRARLQPRQMFAFACAARLGWRGPAPAAIEHALDFFLRRHRRPDGMYRSLVSPDGAALDERAVLYDQAFALLGLAVAWRELGDPRVKSLGHELHDLLRSRLRHPLAGFEESAPRSLPLTANSHMHLLEAALAWSEADDDGCWRALADELAQLALERFIDVRTGCACEFYDGSWQPAAARVEPGHQFEWAWLLLRWRAGDARVRAAALRLIAFAESRGVDPLREVAVDALDASGVTEGQARLWPQTERLRAACRAALVSGEHLHVEHAARAATRLISYLHVPLCGLWRDRMRLDGSFADEPAPASSFFHLAGAIAELDALVQALRGCMTASQQAPSRSGGYQDDS